MKKLALLLLTCLPLSSAGCVLEPEDPTAESADDPDGPTDPNDEEDGELGTAQSAVSGAATNGYASVGMLFWEGMRGPKGNPDFLGDYFQCNATLIAPQIVVTNAICPRYADAVGNVLPAGFFVGPGNRVAGGASRVNDLKGFTRYKVDRVIYHPEFLKRVGKKKTDLHAVALYHLTAPVKGVTPARLATSLAGRKSKDRCTTVGFGLERDLESAAQIKQYAASPKSYYSQRKRAARIYVSNWSWDGAIGVIGQTTSSIASVIHITDLTGDASLRDRGAPLFCGGYLYGVQRWNILYTGAGVNYPERGIMFPSRPPFDGELYDHTHNIRTWARQVASTWRVTAPL